MAKDPAFLFYSQDFIVGVQMMSFEERGKYITLLAQMHQQGRMTKEEIGILVGEITPRLKTKFSIDKKGLFFNKRLEDEVGKRNKYSQSRRNNALKTTKKKSICKAYAKHMHKHMENENEDENEDENALENGKENKTSIHKQIINDLNEVTGSRYKPTTKPNRARIDARLKEGFTLDDFKTVHRKMVERWGNNPEMCQYLRPETLHGNKFESYLNSKEPQTKLTENGTYAYQVGQKWLKQKEAELVR